MLFTACSLPLLGSSTASRCLLREHNGMVHPAKIDGRETLPFLHLSLPFPDLSLPFLDPSLPYLDFTLPFLDLSLPFLCCSPAFP